MTELTQTAVKATAHCLLGCSIGEVCGMVIGTAWTFNNVSMIILSILLAFVFGYGLSLLPLIRHGIPLSRALRLALIADTASIASMEIMDNLVIIIIPGALNAGLDTILFWGSLALSLVVAFIVTMPINRFLIARGKGHAVVHQFHH